MVLREVEGVDQLIAFLVAESSAGLSASSLRSALGARLPPYMVPGRFEVLPQMPRLSSGKIDRKTLKASPLAGAAQLADAARLRLHLLGMPDAEIARVEREGKPSARVTLKRWICMRVRNVVTVTAAGISWRSSARFTVAGCPKPTILKSLAANPCSAM